MAILPLAIRAYAKNPAADVLNRLQDLLKIRDLSSVAKSELMIAIAKHATEGYKEITTNILYHFASVSSSFSDRYKRNAYEEAIEAVTIHVGQAETYGVWYLLYGRWRLLLEAKETHERVEAGDLTRFLVDLAATGGDENANDMICRLKKDSVSDKISEETKQECLILAYDICRRLGSHHLDVFGSWPPSRNL